MQWDLDEYWFIGVSAIVLFDEEKIVNKPQEVNNRKDLLVSPMYNNLIASCSL